MRFLRIFLLLIMALARLLHAQDAEAIRLNNEANRLYAEQRFREAERLYRAALTLKIEDGLKAAAIAANLGTLYKRIERYDEAERFFRQALELRQKLLHPVSVDLAYSRNDLAVIYRIQGRYWEGRNLAKAAVDGLRQADPFDPWLPLLLNNLGVLERHLKNGAEAERLLRESVRLGERLQGPQSKWVAICVNNLAEVLEDGNHFEEAEQLYSRSATVLENLGTNYSYDLAITLANLGRLQGRLGRFAEDEQAQHRALALMDAHPEWNGTVRGEIFCNFGYLLLGQSKAKESLTYFERALELKETTLGKEHPSLAELLADYSGAARAAGRKSQSDKLLKRAKRILALQEQSDPARFSVSADALRDSRK